MSMAGWINYDDALNQMRAAGLDAVALEVDTAKPVRCREIDGGREKRGWYWLSSKEIRGESYITGAFGIYRGSDNGKLTIKIRREGATLFLSAEERAAIKARHDANMKRMKALRKAEADRAARAAEHAWRQYLPTGDSDYLTRKGVQAHGLRFSPSGNGTLAVPMLRAGRVVGLQIIRGKDRGCKLEKEYWPKGMDKVGAYHLLGAILPGGVCLVAEGYASAATIFEALGGQIPVAVAFDAGSLMPVGKQLSTEFRGVRLLFCADDDYLPKCKHCRKRTPVDDPTCRHCGDLHERQNEGFAAARNAADAMSSGHGAWVAPRFAAERPLDGPKKPTDYNDLAALEGLHVVRAQIETHLAGLGWQVGAPARGANGSRGAGNIPSIIPIGEAVERFVMIYGGGGTWFDAVEHMLVPKADVSDVLPEHGLRDLRGSKRVVRMDAVGFDPAGADPRVVCNLWGGWPTEPKEGDCSCLLELLEYLCSGENNPRELYQWVLKWLAYPIQHPGAKMRTALILHGGQGAGKNLFFEAMMAIYGEYGRIIDQAAIEDKFNDWASRKLFLIGDEVVARQELFHVKNKLKGLVTGEWIRINPKNVAAHDERNHVNIVFLSNETQPLVLDKDDRRYAVIHTPDKLGENFYRDVADEIAAGGIEALHWHLLHLPLGEFNEHTKPPMTDAKRALIDVSLDSVERFIRDWMEGDIILDRNTEQPLPFCPCGSAHLYHAYQRWCRIEGVSKPREQNQFYGNALRRRGWQKVLRDRFENLNTRAIKRQRMLLPSDADLAAVHQTSAGRSPGSLFTDWRQQPDENLTEWMTRCFFAFRDALGDLQ